ncbi:hypothetical protein FVE67_04550 [Thermosulfurimonas marina]|uniref:ATP-grasp fold RimK-type domain-containing protein n=1 Tax=Thermosulfurimonas marina TaxID=2047767 RepID=A0A6H1WSH7_9BACT|nr:hypothetical protein [Thermosulfurimonas marina]QJA06109.1 hypothetical protein FVE67_04550 [Thermosulfurimonas marina]
MRPPWVILSNRALRARFQDLEAGDLLLVPLSLKRGEEGLFLDLAARGVEAFPSLLSQALSRSKCLQAAVLKEFMPPHTLVVYDRHDLLRAVALYERLGIEEVVTKEDRANCGLGIHLWSRVEEVYNHAGGGPLAYPFVLQPRFRKLRDIRVILLGDYEEAYLRENPYGFRNNLYFGAEARPYELSEAERDFCLRALARGRFPYAHLDLIYTETGGPYLSEINLRGGLKGARVDRKTYEKKLSALREAFLKDWLSHHPEAQLIE